MWTIFKDFIEFVTILLLFYVLVFWPRGMWDLSSPTRDRIHTPCIGRQSLNNWTAREVPAMALFDSHFTFSGALVSLSNNDKMFWVISRDSKGNSHFNAFAFVPDFLCVLRSHPSIGLK